MITDVGEYIVGSYLKTILECDFIGYNIRHPGGGMVGLQELDVLGLNFKNETAYLCEVTTHIRGFNYGTYEVTLDRVNKKHQNQKKYANMQLKAFPHIRFMFWSPVVPVGILSKGLSKIDGLELIINGKYKDCMDELRAEAKKITHDTGNPFFRMLQIVEHMRD